MSSSAVRGRVVVLGLARALRRSHRASLFSNDGDFGGQQKCTTTATRAQLCPAAPLPRPSSAPLYFHLEDEEIGECARLLEDFEIGEVCGSGAFGTVVAVRHKIDDQEYAVKISRDGDKNEARILASLGQHPSIVRYFGSWMDGTRLCVQLERLGDTLREFLDGRTRPTPFETVRSIAASVASGLAFLHQSHVAHLDLSPSNVLRAERGWVLCDFGSAQRVDSYVPNADGHVHYIAPNREHHPTAADVWSLGLLFYELVVPFATVMERISTIDSLLSRKEPIVVPQLHGIFHQLIPSMTHPDFARRPTADSVATLLH